MKVLTKKTQSNYYNKTKEENKIKGSKKNERINRNSCRDMFYLFV